jgi:hypothetical protein
VVKIKERMNGAVRFVCIGRPYAHGQTEDDASNENTSRTFSLERDIRSDFAYRAELFHRTSLGA